MDARKLIGPAFAALLIGAIGGGIWYSHSNLSAERDTAAQRQLEATREIRIHGLIGSEKEALSRIRRSRRRWLASTSRSMWKKAGSRDIARRFDPQHFDFGFPSERPQRRPAGGCQAHPDLLAFLHAIVIASWRPIAQILVADRMVVERDGNYFVTDCRPCWIS